MASKDGVIMDAAKIEVIEDWARPISSSEDCSLIGLVGYHRQFVECFATIIVLMTILTQREVPFLWSEECE